MTKRYRLIARAQIDGELREPGYVFTLPDGVLGPHRTVTERPGVNIVDHLGTSGRLIDEPLYVKIDEAHAAALDEAEAKAIAEADAHAAATGAPEQVEGNPETNEVVGEPPAAGGEVTGDPAGDDAAHRAAQDADNV